MEETLLQWLRTREVFVTPSVLNIHITTWDLAFAKWPFRLQKSAAQLGHCVE